MTGGQLIGVEDLKEWLGEFARLIFEHRDELTALDAAIGDADHGNNMSRGMAAVAADLSGTTVTDDLSGTTVASLAKRAGMTLVSSVGGASGPLYGTFFLRFASSAGEVNQLDASSFAVAMRAGLDGLVSRGKAELGDKTMVDALAPAVDVLDAIKLNRCRRAWMRPGERRTTGGMPPSQWWRGRAGRVISAIAVSATRIRVPRPPPFSLEPPQPHSGEEMVGIVVVSHSWPLARAAVEMTRQMVPAPVPRIEIAAGLDEHTLGTDAVRVGGHRTGERPGRRPRLARSRQRRAQRRTRPGSPGRLREVARRAQLCTARRGAGGRHRHRGGRGTTR